MGGKSESEVKTIIQNELSIEIESKTKNINNISRTVMNEVSQNIKQSAEASVSSSTTGSNIMTGNSLVVTGGASVDINQDAKVKSVNQAIIKIISDASSLQKLGNDIADSIANKVSTDQQAKQDMEALSKIGEFSKKSGGPEGMVDTIAGMVKDMMKNITGSNDSQTTEIKNTIKSKLSTEVVNENLINNTIKTATKTTMEQMAKAKCDFNTTGQNIIDYKDIIATGDGTKLKLNQSVSIEAFNKCLVDLNLGSKIASDLTNGFKTTTTTDTTNTQKNDQDQKTNNDISKTDIKESAIMNSFDKIVNTVGGLANSWMLIVGGITLVIVLIIGYLFYSGRVSTENLSVLMPYASSSNIITEETDDIEDQEGGGSNELYLLFGLGALSYFMSYASIPLCGLLLIITFLYFSQKIII